MAERNFSMQKYWENKVKNWKPLNSFDGTTYENWVSWKEHSNVKLLELLGEFPERVPLEPEVEFSVEDGDLIRERVVFNSEAFMSVPCYVLKPKSMKSNRSNAAILCCHGHGKFGKEPVAGVRSNPECEKDINLMNYNYAEQMARAGFLTITPDLRAFGERSSMMGKDSKDTCNINFLNGAILGIYTLTLNIWDMMCCIDYLETREEVDLSRIGMMGLSQGGTMTTFTAAVDKRIKAADIIGYVNPWAEFGIKRGNYCGSQIIPSIYKYFDTHDIAGLIAPRPLLVEMGIYDSCFHIRDLLTGYKGIEIIYTAAGVKEQLYSDIHPGPHAFAGNKAFDFFKKHL